MVTNEFTQFSTGPLQVMWIGLANFVPSLIAALVIFVVGLIIATGLGAIIQKVFETFKFDSIVKRLGIEPYFERAGLKLRPSWFFGQLVFWFLVIAFLLTASDILGLSAISVFLQSVLFYIPNIIVAALIMVATIVIANFLRGTVTASLKSAKLPAEKFIGSLIWWVVIFFGILATLNQLNVATSIINSIVTGFIAMLALAGGLAFGLGGRDYATDMINKLREYTENR